ncbi:MAG: MoxR-like ATPase [Myxococcota bacterium]|jgi:MoxR-like ATPase
MQVENIQQTVAALRAWIRQVVVGQTGVVDGLLIALLAEGHVLLEGPPGTAKTLLARTFSRCLSLDFSRIQFTPDLMPGDVLGTSLFNFQTSAFTLTKGPIFTDFLLADEINRTPPKTQSALLQAMQERIVTIDGVTHTLSPGFMVIATQNPIEHEGTYPLPEAQLDRFLLKIDVPYPSREEERAIVKLHGNRSAMPNIDDFEIKPVTDLAGLMEMREVIRTIRLSDALIDYVVDLIRATRSHPSVINGASPRAANMLATAARAQAALCGRDFVIPDDIKRLVPSVLRHRIMLSPGAEVEGSTPNQVLDSILQSIPAPR